MRLHMPVLRKRQVHACLARPYQPSGKRDHDRLFYNFEVGVAEKSLQLVGYAPRTTLSAMV